MRDGGSCGEGRASATSDPFLQAPITPDPLPPPPTAPTAAPTGVWFTNLFAVSVSVQPDGGAPRVLAGSSVGVSYALSIVTGQNAFLLAGATFAGNLDTLYHTNFSLISASGLVGCSHWVAGLREGLGACNAVGSRSTMHVPPGRPYRKRSLAHLAEARP